MLSEWKLAVIFSEGRYSRNMKIWKCRGSQMPHIPFLLNKSMLDLKAYILEPSRWAEKPIFSSLAGPDQKQWQVFINTRKG